MRKILLVGNPNVGKSCLFSRLTGAKVIISNYPGTTVEFTQGITKIGAENFLIIDAPGTYTLAPLTKAEEVACKLIEDADFIINVVDSTNLERNLSLTLELVEKDKPLILVLNMWDESKHKGVTIDYEKLEEILKIPVIPTCALTGEGIRELVNRIKEAKVPYIKFKNKWEKIGEILKEVQSLKHRHHTLLERFEDFTVHPVLGFIFLFLVVFISLKVVKFLGEFLIDHIFSPFFGNWWKPLVMHLSSYLGTNTLFHEILIGKLLNGEINFEQSFGLLTTGIYIPIGVVLPYIFSFYFVLGILEDIGYLPRLAILVDNVMHKLGLHGQGIISMILGLGCNVPGALATRILETKRERFICATLMAICVPCMAQIAVIVGLVGKRGIHALGIVFFILFFLWCLLGIFLNKTLKGTSPEIFLEIPPYRIPYYKAVFKKLYMRITGFLFSALPLVLLGVLLVNLLYSVGIINFLAEFFSPILVKLWGLPKEVIFALIIGFLRKDIAVGMLEPLHLSTKQLIISSVILTIYFPCIATFVVLIKELGIKDMLRSLTLMAVLAFSVGFLLNLFL